MIAFLSTHSIRRRLTLQLLAIAALLAVMFYFIVNSLAERSAESTQDNILLASAMSIAEAVRADQGRINLDLPYSALSMLGGIHEDRVFYRVTADGDILTGYEDLSLPENKPGIAIPTFDTREYRGEFVRVATVKKLVTLQAQPVEVFITVAQTRNGLRAISGSLSTITAALGIGFFLIAGALSYLAALTALRPINRLALSVSRRGPSDLRPVPTDTPSELQPLVTSLNSFISRLKSTQERTQDFIAEAAHRVRTPLATVRTQTEIALRKVERPETKKSLRTIVRAVDESSRSAGQLLDHAMVSFRTDRLSEEPVDLTELAEDVKRRLEPTADLKDIDLAISRPDQPCLIKGDYILLENAVRNLVDNAIKYSPEESDVTIKVIHESTRLSLEVHDQGPGFGDSDLEQLKERFRRGTNIPNVVGSGLGLTIADEVVRAHKGQLKLKENSQGSGACVSLIFPLS